MMSDNAMAWALVTKLFGQHEPTLTVALSDLEQTALTTLSESGLAKKGQANSQYVLCPYCQLSRGQAIRRGGDLYCRCQECGEVPLDLATLGTWQIDADKLIRQLRLALEIPPQQPQSVIVDGIWSIGKHNKTPVILARSMEAVLRHQSDIKRSVRNGLVITPKPLRPGNGSLDNKMEWLPMEERFHFYGGQIRFLDSGTSLPGDADELTSPVYGPFSEDFRWVHLDSWQHGPIALSEAQAAVFQALWHFKGVPQQSEQIMNKAGCDSSKPIDVFKVKSANKGDPYYEGPLHAYKELVLSERRAGTYTMACAIAP